MMKCRLSVIILILLLLEVHLYGQIDQSRNGNNSALSNKGLYSSKTSGFYNNGVVLSAIANSDNPNEARSAICGFVDGRTASKYPGRDAVAFYAENNNPVPIIVKNARFEKDRIILPDNIDIYQFSEGDYVDVFNNGYIRISEGNKKRWTSIIDSIDYETRTIRVKYGGFYRVQNGGSEVAETPDKGSVVYFKLTTKIWGLNSVVISRSKKDNKVTNICGYELDISNNDKNCYAEGMTVVSLGKYKGDIAYDVEGQWDAGYLARNPTISFYSRDDGNRMNKYVLRQDKLKDGKYQTLGYISNDFVYHQGRGYLSLDGESPCIYTAYGSMQFSKSGGISICLSDNNYKFDNGSFTIKNHSWNEGLLVMGDYSLWINKGKLYIKRGTPTSATDGKPLQENSSGKYGNRPKVDVTIGEMYFCTDRSLPESDTEGIAIFYKGDGVWVDALGRIIK